LTISIRKNDPATNVHWSRAVYVARALPSAWAFSRRGFA